MKFESKSVFFTLSSILIFIIILNLLKNLRTDNYNKKAIVNAEKIEMYPPVYYGGPYRKTILYAPDVYLTRRPYDRRYW